MKQDVQVKENIKMKEELSIQEQFNFADFRWPGVLQRIGICYFFGAVAVLNLRVRVFMYLMRPVPTVLLPLAFSPQRKFLILAAGYPQLEHVFF